MKILAVLPTLSLVLSGYCLGAQQAGQKQPVEYVSPNIGGIGQLLSATVPYVQYPYGMARLAPIVTPGIMDRFLADKIYGFPAGSAVLTAATTGEASPRLEEYASDYDHDFETATPYYYSANLQTWNIKAEFTASPTSAYYRFTFPASAHAHLVLTMEADSELTVVGDHALQGSQRIPGPITATSGDGGDTREYFYAEFSVPFASYQTWNDRDLSHSSAQHGNHIGFVSYQATATGEQVEVRVGISYISGQQARRNLEREIGANSFEHVEAETRASWDRALGRVNVTGGTERQRTIFYTALYRSLGRMTDITEEGRYFSGYDHTVHDAQGHDFYVDDGLWDTFRSLHPLQLLLDPIRQQDMVRSYIRMYEQSGWMPSFPSVAGEQAVMIGHHAAEFILDTYAKGYRDFDLEKAYEGLRKNETQATMLPWKRGPLTVLDHIYFDKGFAPALARGEVEDVAAVTGERRQAVSVTLETAYDDWCVSELAKALGKNSDAAYFAKLEAVMKFMRVV